MLTRLLIAVNVIAYAWEQLTGAFDSNMSLIGHGGLVGAYVLDGQWWRIVSSAFLHGSLTHLLFNMFALYQIGTLVEIIYGTQRMAAIYTVAAFGGGLAVTYLQPDVVTVGASGAIFGLFSALAVAGARMGKAGRDMMRQTTGIIVINLAIGFIPGTNISWQDHVGGLIAGALAGFVLFRQRRVEYVTAAAAPEPSGIAYAQRIDPRGDPGVVTIEHGPVIESPPHPPHP